jgi:hypothetical protein
MIRFIMFGLLLTVAGAPATYGEAAGYKCNIKHSLRLAKDGSPGPNALKDQYRKMEFVIDRASGSCSLARETSTRLAFAIFCSCPVCFA